MRRNPPRGQALREILPEFGRRTLMALARTSRHAQFGCQQGSSQALAGLARPAEQRTKPP
jgi:hypothetical protein